MINWFIQNKVASNLLLMMMFVSGIWALYVLPLEFFPDIKLDIITVSTVYPGATPQEVDDAVTQPIAQSLDGIVGISSVNSRSSEGISTVTVKLTKGAKISRILDEVRSKVDALSVLPTAAESPSITENVERTQVISFVAAGDLSELQLKELILKVRADLLALDGISQVQLLSNPPIEISISIPEARLIEHGLTMEQISAAVRNYSLSGASGSLHTASGDLLLRVDGKVKDPNEFARIPIISRADGSELYLGDIADIHKTLTDDGSLLRFNGQPAAVLEIYRVGKQSTTEVASLVREYTETASRPAGVSYEYFADTSKILKARVNTMLGSMAQGAVLVLLLLSLFLRPKIAFFVTLGLPAAFLSSFLVLYLLGYSLNMVSLFAYMLVLGIVVDDAIVTSENIYKHLLRGTPPLQAAMDGTHEIASPVTFGVLTTTAAFVPLATLTGASGDIWRTIPAVVIPVLLLSLVQSKFVLPAHMTSVHISSREEDAKHFFMRLQRRVAIGLDWVITRLYQPTMRVALRNCYAVIALFTVLLAISLAFIAGGWTQIVFFPKIESDQVSLSYTLPDGTPKELVNKYVVRIENAVLTLKERYAYGNEGKSLINDDMYAYAAGATGGVGFSVALAEDLPPDVSPVSSTQLVNEWRELIGSIPGVKSLTFNASIGAGGVGEPINVQFTGDQLPQLRTLSKAVRARLETYSGVFGIRDNVSEGKLEINIRLKPEAQLWGMRLSDIANQTRQAFYGYEVQRIQRQYDELKVMLRYPENERVVIEDMTNMQIRTASGNKIPFVEVAYLEYSKGASALYGVDGKRVVNVTADIDYDTADLKTVKADLRIFLDDLVTGTGVSWSFEGGAREESELLGEMARGFLLVLVAIYVLLAVPLKSYWQPFIVMSVLPFGLVGAWIGHVLLGKPMSMMSLLGILALCGVVVNDSMLLSDNINRRLEKGVPLRQALFEAGGSRFRPIILTSATTFLGLIPILFNKTAQAQFMIPMAISLGFGILFATLLTLVLVPMLFVVTDDVHRLLGGKPRPEVKPHSEVPRISAS